LLQQGPPFTAEIHKRSQPLSGAVTRLSRKCNAASVTKASWAFRSQAKQQRRHRVASYRGPSMRINLAVPFSEKDEAKRLGARWDFDGRTWYIENPEDLAPFMRWLNQPEVNAKPRNKKARPLAQRRIVKGERVTGSKYVPSCGRCVVPPWEICDCSALLNSPSNRTVVTENALTVES
jgi:hypothetical protein